METKRSGRSYRKRAADTSPSSTSNGSNWTRPEIWRSGSNIWRAAIPGPSGAPGTHVSRLRNSRATIEVQAMIIRKAPDLRYSQVTPREEYLNRRRFLAAGTAAAGALLLPRAAHAGAKLNNVTKSPFSTSEKLTSLQDITHYNNFYELGTDKEDPSKNANKLKTSPWTMKVEGLVDKPLTFDQDSIMKIAPLEE